MTKSSRTAKDFLSARTERESSLTLKVPKKLKDDIVLIHGVLADIRPKQLASLGQVILYVASEEMMEARRRLVSAIAERTNAGEIDTTNFSPHLRTVLGLAPLPPDAVRRLDVSTHIKRNDRDENDVSISMSMTPHARRELDLIVEMQAALGEGVHYQTVCVDLLERGARKVLVGIESELKAFLDEGKLTEGDLGEASHRLLGMRFGAIDTKEGDDKIAIQFSLYPWQLRRLNVAIKMRIALLGTGKPAGYMQECLAIGIDALCAEARERLLEGLQKGRISMEDLDAEVRDAISL